ncbi:MAG: glutamate synthase subunit alpha, partial [Chloroflexota bacterium]|nr:glutamate synthase subunit alpha [Chloroflexota bacterium]
MARAQLAPTLPPKFGLYDPNFEHDACGVGFVAKISGEPSHRVLALGLESVANVTHRGAVGADANTGDGAGVLTQLPRRFFARELERLGVSGVAPADIAVAMVFFPADAEVKARCASIIERACDRHGLRRLAWRSVPVNAEVLGAKARATQPEIEQLILGRPMGLDDDDFERVLYLSRKEIERRVAKEGIGSFYIPSMSLRTIVYKGLVVPPQLAGFFLDLADPVYETALCVFHQRYSTNTFPTWFLAQPLRMLAHNGEINTEWGNRNWMAARESDLASPLWGQDVEWLKPICVSGGSDSAALDNALEAVQRSGRDVLHSMMMLVPEAWEHMPDMDPARRAFYEYSACLIEPWDGPAALAFSDGRFVSAALDRNGLRPARYKVTRDGLVVMASEVGVVEIDDADVVEKGRLGPGEMIAVDTETGRLLYNAEIKREVAARRPYGEWLKRRLVRLETRLSDGAAPEPAAAGGRTEDDRRGAAPGLNGHAPSDDSGVSQPQNGTATNTSSTSDAGGATFPHEGVAVSPNGAPTSTNGKAPAALAREHLPELWRLFGWTQEDVRDVVTPMAAEGQDQKWSMGDDAPIAILSGMPRPLYTYFRQRFAQVTNPPIDPLLEGLVMSLSTYLGRRGNLFAASEEHAALLHVPGPVLLDDELAALSAPEFNAAVLPMFFDPSKGEAGLDVALEDLCRRAAAAADAGHPLLVLTDRGLSASAAASRAPIPALLATGAVHHHLIREGKQMRADLIVQTGEAWDIHHLACLLGYGAGAVHPYL